jgi:glycosyltransferase involved in cell wall biosynthesis
MTRPAVLMIGNFLSASGGNRGVCEELAERLALSGLAVITASARRPRAARLGDMLTTAWRERGRYQVAQVDLFSGAAFQWAQAVCRLLRAAGKPYVLSLHGGGLPDFAVLHSARVRRLLSAAAEVTSPSRYLAEAMARYRPGIRLVPNGIELASYPFRLRRNPRPRLVWLRAFHETYDPAMAVRALRAVSDLLGDCELESASGDSPALEMYGPDKHDGSLEATKAAAEALGVRDRLRIPGPIPKSLVPQALDAGDIFLNSSATDNAPVSVLEAMACGMCVVSTNAGGIPHLLTHEENALLVPARDPDAMARAVVRLLHDPNLAERISANARRSANTFDWANILPQWHSVLRSAAGARGST